MVYRSSEWNICRSEIGLEIHPNYVRKIIRKQHKHADLSYYIPYVICFFTLPAIELVGLRHDLRWEYVEGKCDNVDVMDANYLPKSDPRNHRLQRTVQLNTVQYILLVVWLSLVQSGASDK